MLWYCFFSSSIDGATVCWTCLNASISFILVLSFVFCPNRWNYRSIRSVQLHGPWIWWRDEAPQSPSRSTQQFIARSGPLGKKAAFKDNLFRKIPTRMEAQIQRNAYYSRKMIKQPSKVFKSYWWKYNAFYTNSMSNITLKNEALKQLGELRR